MSFRTQVLHAGASLGLREAGGIAIRIGGVVALTRLLGPNQFGVYAGAVAVVAYLSTLAQFGTEVYLIREEEEPSRAVYSQVFTFLVATSVLVSVLALLGSFLVEALIADGKYIDVFRVLLISIPINVLWVPAVARIERAFRYRAIALVEVGGDALLYGVSVLAVILGAGVWGPVIGYMTWQTWLLGASYVLAPQRVRLHLPRERLAELVSAGRRISAWIWATRAVELVNPLVVGGFLGSASVAYVSFAARLADTLTFVTRATFRLALAAFGRVQTELPRLRRGLEEGMGLQVLVCGPLLAGFALVAAWLVPRVFGERWEPMLDVFPFVALFYLAEAAFALHGSVLMVRGMERLATQTMVVRLVVLAGVAAALVPLIGTVGYGLAAVASLVAYAFSDAAVRRLFPVDYRDLALMLVAFVPPLFAPLVPGSVRIALLLPALVVLVSPPGRVRVRSYFDVGMRVVTGGGRVS